MIQTPEYARAMLQRSVIASAADVERMVEDRAQRLARTKSADAPRLWLAVGEEALYREIGGASVLRAQLEEVRDLTKSPNICVQVVPFDAGAHASHGVLFTIVTLIPDRPGVVYVEGLTAADYLGREHVRTYSLAFDSLRANALSEQRTVEKINRRIRELA